MPECVVVCFHVHRGEENCAVVHVCCPGRVDLGLPPPRLFLSDILWYSGPGPSHRIKDKQNRRVDLSSSIRVYGKIISLGEFESECELPSTTNL